MESCDECRTFMPISKRMKSFFTEREKYGLEWRMIQYSIGAIGLLILLLEVVAFSVWRENTLFLKQMPWLVYLVITVCVVLGALWHVRAHKVNVSSMMGMMIGMVLGMQAGVMMSVVIGSTNGMFMGSVMGLLFGVTVGVYAGRCCGLMGVLNGAIMGAMGGTMGPMIALMMKVDHILWFMPLFTLLNVLILWSLNFLVYEEVVSGKKIARQGTGFVLFFLSCLIMTIIGVLIIVYGYSSAFAAL